MSTVATVGNRALRLLGVLASGVTPSTNEQADYLTAINAMLGTWDNEKLLSWAEQDESFSLVAAQSSYTIGSGGDFSTTRPVRIEGAYIVYQNISYPVEVIDDEQYAALPAKTSTASWPDRICYRPTMTSSKGTILVYPVPTLVSTLHLLTRTQWAPYVATTDTLTLPPGAEDALAYNLAVAIAPEYEREASPTVQSKARETLAALKRVNGKPIRGSTDLPGLLGGGRSCIISNS